MSDAASITIKDPRVSKVINWVWSVLAVGAISVIGLAANNLYNLNIAVNRMLDAATITTNTLKDHEDRIRTLEREKRNEPAR